MSDRVISLDQATRHKGGRGKPPSGPDWLKHVHRDDKGRPVGNLANAMVALRSAPEVRSALAYDEMLCAPVLKRDLPAVHVNELGSFAGVRSVRDTDVSQLQEWLQREGLPRLSKDVVHQAVDLRAQECAFHPVKEYLTGLRWDGVKRLGTWLSTYLGAETSPYSHAIGTMFLTACVARIFDPGCKVDYMPVFEGPQGARKSTACAILGGQWFSDNLPDVTADKDVSQHLVGKWIIEISELSAMSKAESATLKAFISRPVERYRPTYGRKEIIQPRMCCFVGSTNENTYLRDETGGRRFWPVKVGTVDTDALARDRDQLFAEAVAAYRSGGRWWPNTEFERQHIAPEQDQRFVADVWEDNIRAFLVNKETVLVGQVARECLMLEIKQIGRAEQHRITTILRHLQWDRRKKDGRGNIPWGPLKSRETHG